MSQTHPQTIIMWSGATVIAIGIFLIVFQFAVEIWTGHPMGGLSGGQFNTTGGINVTTSYVGVMVLGIGALLEIIGYLVGRPWRGVE